MAAEQISNRPVNRCNAHAENPHAKRRSRNISDIYNALSHRRNQKTCKNYCKYCKDTAYNGKDNFFHNYTPYSELILFYHT